MNEEFYNELIHELNRMTETDGLHIQVKVFKFRDIQITYAVESARLDTTRIRINNQLLVYENGVYSSINTALYHGISVTELDPADYYVPNGVDPDVKETVDAAVTEFYKASILK